MNRELVVVSHRLPVEIDGTRGGLRVRPSPGGLARALNHLLQTRRATWIGFPGEQAPSDLDLAALAPFPYRLRPITLDAQEVARYYRGFSNQIVWPLFHDLHPYCEFEPSFWETYQRVNQRFADAVTKAGDRDSALWVHDYQLTLVPRMVRHLGDRRPIGFFLHIPFPSPDMLQRLPWHRELLEALVHTDLIGFQTARDLDNFVASADALLPEVWVGRRGARYAIEAGGHALEAGVFPISIDAGAVRRQAASVPVETRYRRAAAAIGDGQRCIVGVERLDYTKGIPERLTAFQRALERYPELRGKVTLIQHINPSREEIPLYTELRDKVERLVGHINGAFGSIGWVPIRYSYSHLAFEAVLTLYRLADVALITPLRDGMNLVAKEYCVAKPEGDGVLILSQFAGAAEPLKDHALLVNPHDIDQVARAIHTACTMPAEERRRRMRAMQDHIEDHDVHAWAQGFLDAIAQSAPAPRGDVARAPVPA